MGWTGELDSAGKGSGEEVGFKKGCFSSSDGGRINNSPDVGVGEDACSKENEMKLEEREFRKVTLFARPVSLVGT